MIRGGQHLHQVEAPVLIHSTSWHVVSACLFQGLWAQAGQSKGDLRKTLPTHAGEAFPKCPKLVAVAGLPSQGVCQSQNPKPGANRYSAENVDRYPAHLVVLLLLCVFKPARPCTWSELRWVGQGGYNCVWHLACTLTNIDLESCWHWKGRTYPGCSGILRHRLVKIGAQMALVRKTLELLKKRSGNTSHLGNCK